ncbi:MAG: EAL domain-containing protein [Solirubrobacterales bacterium]|nr:EAL domain-containing protein [Solirubrobacterales bacterium]
MVKIDRAFIAGLPHDHGDTTVVASVVRLGHQLGLEILAEGIETDEQLTTVREMGCNLVQGYLLGRPMPIHQTDRFCRRLTQTGAPSQPG